MPVNYLQYNCLLDLEHYCYRYRVARDYVLMLRNQGAPVAVNDQPIHAGMAFFQVSVGAPGCLSIEITSVDGML